MAAKAQDTIKALEARVAHLEKTVAGSLTGRHPTITNTVTAGVRPETATRPSGLLAAASAACIVLGWLGCCMTTYYLGKLALKTAGKGPLFSQIPVTTYVGFAASMAILAGGVGLMLKHRWAWCLALAGFLASLVILGVIMNWGRGPNLTYIIDIGVVVAMMAWLVWLRKEIFSSNNS